MMNATAVTAVFWDIGSCPVPPDFDAGRVGPCIKRFLEKSGYSGPLTIRAIGRLTDFPLELLQTLSSTGIFLHMAPYDATSVQSAMFGWNMKNKPPANVMVISDPTDLSFSRYLEFLRGYGYNIILPYPFCPAECNIFWQHFLLAESAALEADKCIETSESPWLCTVCFGPPGQVGVTGQGFESFSTHISSQEHKESFLEFITPPSGSDEDYEYEEAVGAWSENSLPGATLCGYSPPAYAPTMVMHQPETWQFSPVFATPSEHHRYVTTMGMIQPKQPHMFATPSEYHGKDEPEVVPMKRGRRYGMGSIPESGSASFSSFVPSPILSTLQTELQSTQKELGEVKNTMEEQAKLIKSMNERFKDYEKLEAFVREKMNLS